MYPISRTELHNESQTTVFLGKLNAAIFYAQILSAARSGHTSLVSKSMAPGLAFDTAYEWIKTCFPSCQVGIELHGVFTGDPEYRSYAIRINWDPREG
jgi:hypothetical protein